MNETTPVSILEREMTTDEFDRMNKGFEEHALEYGVVDMPAIRYGYVVLDGKKFIGCVSGLQYRQWFYITNLWLEKSYRKKGIGIELLQKIEMKAKQEGVKHIWTWTAGYEAPSFYQKYGYEIFCDFEEYYSTGDSRIGLRKNLQ